MAIKPVGHRCLIEPAAPPKKSAGGIELPEAAVADTVEGRGTILAFGGDEPSAMTEQGDILALGDSVIFRPFAGQEVLVDSKSEDGTTVQKVLLIVPVSDIVARDELEN